MTLLTWRREPGTAEEQHKMTEQDETSPLALTQVTQVTGATTWTNRCTIIGLKWG